MYNNCAFSGRFITTTVTKPNNTNIHNFFLSVGERLIIHGKAAGSLGGDCTSSCLQILVYWEGGVVCDVVDILRPTGKLFGLFCFFPTILTSSYREMCSVLPTEIHKVVSMLPPFLQILQCC